MTAPTTRAHFLAELVHNQLSGQPEEFVHQFNQSLISLGSRFQMLETPKLYQAPRPAPVSFKMTPSPISFESEPIIKLDPVTYELAPDPKPQIEWTPSQSAAMEKLKAWMEKIAAKAWNELEGKRYFVLRGYAGTGKSFLTKTLHSNFSGRVQQDFCAPTHRATAVLSQYLGFQARTLASRLGVKAVYDEDEILFQLPENPPYIPAGTVLVLDEASMVGKDYLAFLIRIAEHLNIFILFIGDPAQLPPVGERRSAVWGLVKDEAQKHTLVDIRRVKDDAIVDLHVAIREQIFSKERLYINPLPDIANGETVQHIRNERKFMRSIEDAASLFAAGEAKVIAWRNRRVDEHTELIRAALGYGKNIGIGERLTLSGSFIPFGKIDVEEVGLNTEEVVVNAVHESVYIPHCEYLPSLETEIPVSVLELSGESFEASSVAVARTDLAQSKLNEVLSMTASLARAASSSDRRRSRALWEFFWDTKRRFIRPRSAYTATAHSFQGSQCSHVFCDTQDILANPTKSEAFRCFYVAASRCTEKIISN